MPQRALWAGSGAMALTGRPDGPPLLAPASVAARLLAAGEMIRRLCSQLGQGIDLVPLALLGERAAVSGFRRAGDRSCGGATRLLPAGGDWLAVSLARAGDADLVSAWLGLAGPVPGDPWDAVRRALAGGDPAALLSRGRMLGLPVARYQESAAPETVLAGVPLPVLLTRAGEAAAVAPVGSLQDVVVADLSSLWAGPLCGHVLAQAGARVIKVESTRRPDGTRAGPAAFFDLMHGGKESVALDFGTAAGAAALRTLLAGVDVVIEASRPRALEQLGVAAIEQLSAGRPRVWLSITGYGRTGAARDRVAFGDDAAVAGGLVVWDEAGPCFCADAVADPATGLVAAATCLALLAGPGRWLADIPMAGVAAWLAGDTGRTLAPRADADGLVDTAAGPVTVAPPRARPVSKPGPALGADTARVLSELCAGPLRARRG